MLCMARYKNEAQWAVGPFNHQDYYKPVGTASSTCISTMSMSLWIFGLLLISVTETHGLSPFPENFVVAKEGDAKPVILTCGTEKPVTWKHLDKEVLADGVMIQHEGQHLSLSGVVAPMLGNYSCWAGDEMISSTYLLLEAEEEEDLDSPITYWANSYYCNFTCNWTDNKSSAVRLGLGHECAEGGKSCHWVSIYDSLPGGVSQFVLSHTLSPYAEESTKLQLTAQAIEDDYIRKIKRTFYLRDIIRPDLPKIVKWQVVGKKLNVTIDPPSTWSTPHSFFRLEHEIEYIRRDDGKGVRTLSALIPKSISKMRARSRDLVVPSNWSDWTQWEHV